MAKTKYYVRLTDTERAFLTKIICEQKESDRTIMRARILLMSDATQQEKVSIRALAEMLGTTETTIKTVRTEYAGSGMEAALYRKKMVMPKGRPHKQYKRTHTDEVVNKIRELADKDPPHGSKRWTVRSLSEEAIKSGIVEYISPVTVSKILNREKPYN